ncbi:MAG: ATP-binding protein [Methanospirillum sp.]|uniref:ATP-binding protein n=1 Tax=Methanospirillum sp. TaxID=45200 RepID=UPI002373E62F|nr:ATP-binding protein [Methanospirillum sp.]MDD1729435.1 ATP-binding protein [Methanospirillum sp.]
MVLSLILLILILALSFIQFNSREILTSYNEIEEAEMNLTLQSVRDMIVSSADVLGKTTQDYAKWDDTAQYALSPGGSYIERNLQIFSLKNLGITYVAIRDSQGKILYLKQYDPDTYTEISPVFSPDDPAFQGIDTDGGASLLYANGTLLLISQSRISNSLATGFHAGDLIFGIPLQPLIDQQGRDLNLAFLPVQVISPEGSDSTISQYMFSSGVVSSIGEQNDTRISGLLTFMDPSSSSRLQVSISRDKKVLAQGRSFVAVYFWRSVLFCTVAITFGTIVILLLFRRHDKIRSLITVQERELEMLRERREILDKFHQALDNYLPTGIESDQNISLITTTAGTLLGAEAAFYTRFEDGGYSRVCSWPKADDPVHDIIAGFLPVQSGLFGSDTTAFHASLSDEKEQVLASSYPRACQVISRQIMAGDTPVGDLTLFLSGESQINEVNQLILDLLVHALTGEEARRSTKIAFKNRDAVLEAIGYSAGRVIGDLSISSIIEILHKFVLQIGVSEAHVFAWKTGAGKNPILSHDYVWALETGRVSSDQLEWYDLLNSPIRSWLFDANRHTIIAGPADTFPAEHEYLENHGIKSIALIPFLSPGDIGGALILVDRVRKRSWHGSELETLRIAADLLMTTIARIEREEEHERREENFQQFFDHLNDFVFILDTDGRIITANFFAQQEIGIKASDLNGIRLSGLFTSRWMDEPRTAEGYNVVSGLERTAVLLTIEGKEIPVEMRYLPGVWNGSQAVFCICKDITHLKRSEHKFATAFRSSQVLHAIWSLRDGRLIDANTTFFDTTGFSRKEVLNSGKKPGYGIIDPDQFRQIKDVIITEGSVRDREIQLYTKTGGVRLGSLYGALIEIEGDPCVLFSVVDITDRKRAEIRIQSLLQELSASNQGLHDFAHIVAHDLKDPLRGIYTLASWIGEDYHDNIGSEGQKYVQMITDQVQRMYQLIDGIMAYSQAGIAREEKVPVDVGSVIQEVIDILTPPPSVTIRIETDMPVLVAERTKIQQVFQNLIGNSLTHLNREDGEISIRAYQGSGEDPLHETGTSEEAWSGSSDLWTFEVSDNGPGIDPALQESIFEIFRSYPAPGAKKSTGVGLSIVKRIVETSGGSIWVRSSPGTGTSFFFTFGNSGEALHENVEHEGRSDD